MKFAWSPLRFVLAASGLTLGLMILVWTAYLLTARDFFRYTKCSRCGGARNRPSELLSRLDAIARMVTFKPHRCLSCGLRFYNPAWARSVPGKMEPILWTARYGNEAEPAETPTKADTL